MTATKTRRVPRFKERAQAQLNAYPWPDGFTVTVDPYSSNPDVWLQGPGSGRASVRLDPYDLASADPARVVPELVRKLRATGRDPRYTEQSRRDDQAAADMLERCTVDQASEIYRLFRVKDVAGSQYSGWSANPALDNLTVATAAGLITELAALPDLSEEDEEDECESPVSYLDRVDGHWYVCRYDWTLPQIHAVDCATCADSEAVR